MVRCGTGRRRTERRRLLESKAKVARSESKAKVARSESKAKVARSGEIAAQEDPMRSAKERRSARHQFLYA